MLYGRGDEVILKVEEDFGYKDKVFRRVKVMIVGYNTDCEGPDAEYLCYVPCYELAPNSFTLTERHLKYYGVERKFLGDTACFITRKTPIFKHIKALPGEKCDHCKDFVVDAVRVDGTYQCRACKENAWR